MRPVMGILCFMMCACFTGSETHWELRKNFIEKERSRFLGSGIVLSNEEKAVNCELMRLKRLEYSEGFQNITNFPPANHFFDSVERIYKSPVFRIIKKLPKGGMLHGHVSSMVSTDFLLNNITHMENLYICIKDQGATLLHFFENPNNSCDWKSLQELRSNTSNIEKFEKYIQQQLSIFSHQNKELDSHSLWKIFQNVFKTVNGLIRYRPAFELYLQQMMTEMYEDNVMYSELRSSLPKLYELDGHELTWQKSLQIFEYSVSRFMESHPDFLGIRLIYSPRRLSNEAELRKYVRKLLEAHEMFPRLVVGIDLVGEEDYRTPMYEFVNELNKIPRSIGYFFHAGETNWQDMADLNIIDALLLNSTRIGHGYAILKHPLAMDIIKKQNIAIEVCPISNQVLGLVKDIRNHPATHLLADQYPVVIASDDPSFWGANVLSYDMYEAFMGLAGLSADIKVIKQLAANSIMHSAMTDSEKQEALQVWEHKWNKQISNISSELSISHNNDCLFPSYK